MKKEMGISKLMVSFGMFGVVAYFIHTILGNVLWKEYSPITMDISTLTASGSPNLILLRLLTSIYGVLVSLFVVSMLVKTHKKDNKLVTAGYIIMLLMMITSTIGYSLFPLSGDKTVMTFQNTMHIIVTVIVVITTITSAFFLSIGYLRQKRTKKLGRVVLIMTILITLFGILNPINMAMKLNLLGLTERLVIYTLQSLIFYISYVYTFKENY